MIHPDFGLPVRYSTEVVGGGPGEQVERTISLMGKYVLEERYNQKLWMRG